MTKLRTSDLPPLGEVRDDDYIIRIDSRLIRHTEPYTRPPRQVTNEYYGEVGSYITVGEWRRLVQEDPRTTSMVWDWEECLRWDVFHYKVVKVLRVIAP